MIMCFRVCSMVLVVSMTWLVACGDDGGDPGGGGGTAGDAGALAPHAGASGGGEGGAAGGHGDAASGGHAGVAGAGGSAAMGWDDVVCTPERVRIVGTLDGVPVDLLHIPRNFSSSSSGVGAQFAVGGSSANARVRGTFSMTPAPVGELGELATARLLLEASDPYAGIDLCADGAAEGLRESDRMAIFMRRVVPLQCPGMPVSGTLRITPSAVTGNLDGQPIDQLVTRTGRAVGVHTELIRTANLHLLLAGDDHERTASSGQILNGTLTFEGEGLRAPSEDIYCLGSTTFTRDADSQAITAEFTDLSKIGSCRSAPSVGELTICIQDPTIDLDR